MVLPGVGVLLTGAFYGATVVASTLLAPFFELETEETEVEGKKSVRLCRGSIVPVPRPLTPFCSPLTQPHYGCSKASYPCPSAGGDRCYGGDATTSSRAAGRKCRPNYVPRCGASRRAAQHAAIFGPWHGTNSVRMAGSRL